MVSVLNIGLAKPLFVDLNCSMKPCFYLALTLVNVQFTKYPSFSHHRVFKRGQVLEANIRNGKVFKSLLVNVVVGCCLF